MEAGYDDLIKVEDIGKDTARKIRSLLEEKCHDKGFVLKIVDSMLLLKNAWQSIVKLEFYLGH